MKSLRKSLNGTRESSSRPHISTPLPLPAVSKPPSAILPPQKVIRALANYRPQAPQELSFSKGDFFYVLKDADASGAAWYEAHNPVTGARGLVPRAMFEEFGKGPVPNRTSQAVSHNSISPLPSPARSDAPPTPKSQVFYAIVLHDFAAERPDELDAKRGDPITVVAQSNREWFVAKPIGRLGRPGLIPVSFVEIHDPATGKAIPDVDGLMDRGDLPKVEDWKRAMLNYKQNSIALGVLDSPAKSPGLTPNPPYTQPLPSPSIPPQLPAVVDPPRPQTPDVLPEGILLSADVVSFHFEMDEYWFRIDAIYQPYARPGQRLPPSKQLILFRVYNDFYDFQVSLLESFPREAGRQPPEPRTLPYMPGPAQNVDDTLTATRRVELDDYVHALCNLGRTGGRYILEHRVVRTFLALKPGDVENEGDPRVAELDALFNDEPVDDEYDEQQQQYEIQDQMDRLAINDPRRSAASDYEDERYAPSPQQKGYENDQHPYSHYNQGQQRYVDDLRIQAAQNHSRNGSSSSFHQYNSRSNSPALRNGSPQPSHSNGSSQSHSRWTNDSTLQSIDGSSRTSQSIATQRSRSQSNAANNMNTPPISAANPQTAFVKIKIFDRVADDLIAIRVHPKVTHAELMDKVQGRLGAEVNHLRYRDSMTNTFVGLDSDEELRAWMEGTDKHVLYAD